MKTIHSIYTFVSAYTRYLMKLYEINLGRGSEIPKKVEKHYHGSQTLNLRGSI
jgi:hypothetical protein